MLTMMWAENNRHIIGAKGAMPWHNSKDLSFFKMYTYGKVVVMGNTTFKGLPVPLLGRSIIVFSRSTKKHTQTIDAFRGDITWHPDLDDFLQWSKGSKEEIVIAGGRHIYDQCMPFSQKLIVTTINNNLDGDTYAPHISKEWGKKGSFLISPSCRISTYWKEGLNYEE